LRSCDAYAALVWESDARRKEGVVLRLLRGEGLDALARETGQPAGRIAAWREGFLAAGREGLKARPAAVEDRRLADRRVRKF
jgi:transposase